MKSTKALATPLSTSKEAESNKPEEDLAEVFSDRKWVVSNPPEILEIYT